MSIISLYYHQYLHGLVTVCRGGSSHPPHSIRYDVRTTAGATLQLCPSILSSNWSPAWPPSGSMSGGRLAMLSASLLATGSLC
ncbi:hypothetical protein EB796_014623 [Bugula neritina]|uniref:Uncharacterized protein n=1 Tax=Bugula neritina TaxID=10212 RepID=A0A7J7JL33_BUGNE|nr:hypothetical protein EB796_014623 [Bugula neritina]